MQSIKGGLRMRGIFKKSSQNRPLISVVTVVYNRARELETTILSVANQTYDNVDYVIVDGGSSNDTLDVIKKYDTNINYWISESDKGIYDAMNKAIDEACGDWIIFMNAGDCFYSKDVLENVFGKQTFQADIVYGKTIVQYQGFQAPFKHFPLAQIWKYTPFSHQSAFIKFSLMKDYKYDLNYKIGADHDFFYKAYMSKKTFQYIDEIICLFDGRDGATKKQIVQAIKDKMNIALKYDYTLSKKLYFKMYLLYVNINIFIKRLLGAKLVNLAITLLKK
jgi:glycosyltransferase involved in cell wall biosynthesis